ncbi:MAG TPA: molybdopterin cofactor-binding domain-containing protein [Candidatus Limnocylindrales bacterium]|nr:molybdopterin cofactor-binding domain-containing protein [Candidatus Limnocylindrales bacterium]
MRLTINGVASEVDGSPERSLLAVLREELGLTAAKYGCGEGVCGACTVLVEGKATTSCDEPVTAFDGRAVTTLEGLAGDAIERTVAQAFLDERAFQCGYCTPGMVVCATALLRARPDASDDEVVTAMHRNVCRCGTYPRIMRAIARARARLATGADGTLPTPRTPPEAGAIEAVALTIGPAERPARPWDLVEPADRDWFERLGSGVVAVLPPDEVERLGETHGVWSTDGGAWIHLGTDGRATAFTGKVDVGQDNRTALTAVVAEEVGLAFEDVDLMMGDTDLCPFDIGTFGSRSTPDAGTVLRYAGAGLRRWLREAAARRWEIDPSDLILSAGHVSTRDGSQAIDVGELVRDRRDVVTATAHEAPVTEDDWVVAGREHPRRDGPAVVGGRQRYTTDLALPGMLHGRVAHPPRVGASLGAVDSSELGGKSGAVLAQYPDLVGVAAPDPARAEQALEALRITWTVGRETPTEAGLEPWLREHPVDVGGWEGEVGQTLGDVDGARARAASTFEATYRTAYIAHVPLEARAAVAEWERGSFGRLTVWTGTQRPFGVREALAGALGVDVADVRVIVPPTGSGYGGKHHVAAAIEAARLARAAGRAVKVRWTRAEEFQGAYLRPAAVIDVRAALDAGGRLTAWEFTNTNSGGNAIETPYEIPNQRIRYQPADSPLPQGSYRGLAATANTFAREAAMDELAARAGRDAVAFRLEHLDDERLAIVLRAVAERIGWPGVLTAGRGLGIAIGLEKDGRVATGAQVDVGPDGQPRVTRIVTAFDCGAIVDPDNLVNQIEGATVMGLGGALFEAIHFDGGRITNGSLREYRVPRFSDVPPIEVITLDRRDEPSAGAGETPIIAVAPAIANALAAASGRRLRSLPLLDAWAAADLPA